MKELKAKLKKIKCSHCNARGAYAFKVCKVCMGKGWVLR